MKSERLINDIKTRIESLVEQRRSEIKNVETAILTAKEGISKASKEMDDATFTMNKGAYIKAKEKSDEHAVSLEMFERRLEQIRGSELIAESESVAVDESIVKAQDELRDETKEKVRGILDELFKVYADYRDEINALDSVRLEWRERVWKKKKTVGRNQIEIDIPRGYDDGGLSDTINQFRGFYYVAEKLGFGNVNDSNRVQFGRQ